MSGAAVPLRCTTIHSLVVVVQGLFFESLRQAPPAFLFSSSSSLRCLRSRFFFLSLARILSSLRAAALFSFFRWCASLFSALRPARLAASALGVRRRNVSATRKRRARCCARGKPCSSGCPGALVLVLVLCLGVCPSLGLARLSPPWPGCVDGGPRESCHCWRSA